MAFSQLQTMRLFFVITNRNLFPFTLDSQQSLIRIVMRASMSCVNAFSLPRLPGSRVKLFFQKFEHYLSTFLAIFWAILSNFPAQSGHPSCRDPWPHPSSSLKSSVMSLHVYNSQGLLVAPPFEDVLRLCENESLLLTIVIMSTVELNTQSGSNFFVKKLPSKTQLKLKCHEDWYWNKKSHTRVQEHM